MFGYLEESIHQGESPLFYIFDELKFRKKGNDWNMTDISYKVYVATKRSESSSHISLIEFLILDISECCECLESVGFCIVRSESILRAVDEDTITCFELFDIARLSMIGLDKSSGNPTLSMLETDTDNIISHSYLIIIPYLRRSPPTPSSENCAHFIVFSSGFNT